MRSSTVCIAKYLLLVMMVKMSYYDIVSQICMEIGDKDAVQFNVSLHLDR